MIRAAVARAAVTAVGLATAGAAAPGAIASSRLEVLAGPLHFSIAPAVRERWAQAPPTALRWQLRTWMSGRESVRQGALVAEIRWPGRALATLGHSVQSPNATRVRIDVGIRQIEIRRPRLRQVWRNNCETAALSMLLGGDPDQRRLQSLLPVAAPREPRSVARGLVWGDPQVGFVGDVRAGGYGVYERPLLALARVVGADVVNLTGRPFVRLVDALRSGRPVLTWVTLGASSPWSWRTPRGRVVPADRAEHAVVLVGWESGRVVYLDPWDGARKIEDLETFDARWRRLGQRAIALR